jgi:hypothetical protein
MSRHTGSKRRARVTLPAGDAPAFLRNVRRGRILSTYAGTSVVEYVR